jgi:uncharacterized damage-inducible protein DinB
MDPLRTYDYLALARRQLLNWARPLSADQLAREFPIGRATLARTLTHILISEWYYIERLQERPVPPYAKWPMQEEAPPPLPALEAAWTRQSGITRTALGSVQDWASPIEYQVTDDNGIDIIVTASAADIATQLILHEVHDRAQAMNILRQLGFAAEDLDFNALMYKRRPASS